MRKSVSIASPHGMHIRIASAIAMQMNQFPDRVIIKYKEIEYDAKSILGLSSSCIPQGEIFDIIVEGENSKEIFAIIQKIIDGDRDS